MRQRPNESREEFLKRNRAYFKAYRSKNYERESTKWKADHLKNRERDNKRTKEWWTIPKNRKSALAKQAQYAKEHPEVHKKAGAKWRDRNRLKIRKKSRKFASEYRKTGRPQKRHKERYLTDPLYNIRVKLRNRMGMAFYKAKKGTRKHTTTIKLLGCSYAEFKKHIESQFTKGMTWEKVIDGSIHIDHKTPISSFDLADSLQQKAAFHFTNTQPLWATENISKGCKIIPFERAA